MQYEERREGTRQMIEQVLASIEANGTEPSAGQYDNLSDAMRYYQAGDFYVAVVSADRAQYVTGVQQKSDLFGTSEKPDRSVSLRSVWVEAQDALCKLEAAGDHG